MKLISLLLVILLAACSKPAPVVVLDSWWNVDYAKQWCNNRNPCFPDPVQGVREFETELVTQFAAQSACGSVRFVRYDGPQKVNGMAADAIAKDNWSLSLNFTPDRPKQEWKMIQSPKNTIVMQGIGGPDQIAKDICAIVNGHGAAIEN